MKKYTKKTALNLLIILLISIGCTFFFAGFSSNITAILLNVLYGILIGLTIAVGSSIITRFIYRNEKVYEEPTKYFILAMLLVATYIIVSVTLVNFLWFNITQGTTFTELFTHRFAIYALTSEFIIGLLIYLIALVRYFMRDLKKYYVKAVETESQLAKYQYDTLKNQLNPHFLFNSLNTLSGLIYMDVDKADEFIHRLSKLYRYVLDMQKEEVVPVQAEMELVNDFLYLNNIRFNNQIETSISLDNSNGFIAPMALQLLIENAIKHNKISDASPLKVEINEENGYILVRNNIQLKQEKEPSHELGLNNLHERYATLTDQKVVVQETKEYFLVRVPILEKESA
ncbi:MAG: sensor histidine kinase [Crocinitomicaceae bacterium]